VKKIRTIAKRSGSSRHLHPASSPAAKLQKSAQSATMEARRQNKILKLPILVAKSDGLYLFSKAHGFKLVKKGNYKPIKVTHRIIDLG